MSYLSSHVPSYPYMLLVRYEQITNLGLMVLDLITTKLLLEAHLVSSGSYTAFAIL